MSKTNDFRQKATAAIIDRLTSVDPEGLHRDAYANLTAEAVTALEPLFTDIETQLAERPTFVDTLEDIRVVALGGIKDGVNLVAENLTSDGPLFTGVSDAFGKATDLLGKKAAEYRGAK
jgi:hypothetical protein